MPKSWLRHCQQAAVIPREVRCISVQISGVHQNTFMQVVVGDIQSFCRTKIMISSIIITVMALLSTVESDKGCLGKIE